MGIEHPQIVAVARLAAGDATYVPTPDLMDPGGKTPNQRWLALSIALTWSRFGRGRSPLISRAAAVAEVTTAFRGMRAVGHQAVATGYGCEQGCPDPHAGLWMGAMATIFREAHLLNEDDVLDDVVRYFADHVNMLGAFWTPAGPRLPCSRAAADPGQALRPNWTVDSWAYAMIHDLPVTGLGKPDGMTLGILRTCADHFPAIVAMSKVQVLKLASPIRRWARPEGGFVAAFEQATPMNDPLAWIVVDATGAVLDAGRTLDGFTVPSGLFNLVGGGASSPIVVTPPAPAPSPTLVSAPGVIADPAELGRLADRLDELLLSHKDAGLRSTISARLRSGRSSAGDLAAMTVQVAALGIGPAQPQAVEQRAIAAELRQLAGVVQVPEHPPPAASSAPSATLDTAPPATPALSGGSTMDETNRTIGDFLVSKGCNLTIFWGSFPHVLRKAPWDAAKPWNGTDSMGSYLSRYGYINQGYHDGRDPLQAGIGTDLFSAGTAVGEVGGGTLGVQAALQALITRPDNPCGLKNWTSYKVTVQDAQDAQVVKDPKQDVSVYLTIFAGLYHGAVVATSPGNVPTNISPGIVVLPASRPLPPTTHVGSGTTAAAAPPPAPAAPTSLAQVSPADAAAAAQKAATVHAVLALLSMLLSSLGGTDGAELQQLLAVGEAVEGQTANPLGAILALLPSITAKS